MTEKRWKRAERQVAAILGGERVPVNGRIRGSAPDVSHSWLAIEVKSRKNVPDWLLDAMRQAEASGNGSQLPIAVIHPVGAPVRQSLVVVRLDEFAQWFGAGPRDLGAA